jgi:hypothetical protein
MRNTKKGRNKYTKKGRNKYTKKSINKTKYNRCKKKFRSKKSRKLTVNKPKHGGSAASERQATPEFPWRWCSENDETICNESLEKYIELMPKEANCTEEQLRDKYILSCKDYIINTLASIESHLGPKPWFPDNGFATYKAKILDEYEKLSQKQQNLYLLRESVTASNNSPPPPLVDATEVEVLDDAKEVGRRDAEGAAPRRGKVVGRLLSWWRGRMPPESHWPRARPTKKSDEATEANYTKI